MPPCPGICSQHLRRVKDGESLAITERGRVIGRIVPVRASPEDVLAALAQTGMLAWNGGRLELSGARGQRSA